MKSGEQIISFIECEISDLIDIINYKEKQIKTIEKSDLITPVLVFERTKRLNNIKSDVSKLNIEQILLTKLLNKIKQ